MKSPRGAVLAAAGLFLLANGAFAEARLPVLLMRDGRVYAAWSPAGGAREGARARLVAPSGETVDTLVVAWVRDDVAALVGRAAHVDSTRADAFWIEPLAAVRGRPGGTLRVPVSAVPASFDPVFATSLADKQVLTQVYEGLVRFDLRLAPVPAACDSIAHDGATWTFRLRGDAVFHDGTAVGSNDVVRSLERALAPTSRAPRVEGLADAIDGGREYHSGAAPTLPAVRAVDTHTVEIVASGEGTSLLDELAAPAAYIVPASRTAGDISRAPIGSGPFRFVSADTSGVTLVAAAGRTSGIDTLEFRHVADPADAALDFELGRLDVVAPREVDEARLRKDNGVLTVDEAATYYLGMDTRSAALATPGVRRTLARAIDRALAVRVLVPGRGRLAQGLVPPSLGLAPVPDSAWRGPAARPPLARTTPLSLWLPDGSPTGERMAEFIQASLARAGVRVSLVVRPWKEFERGVNEGRADLFYLSWFADSPDPTAFVASLVESRRRGAGGNRTFYSNARVDSLLEAARGAPDDAQRKSLTYDAEVAALRDAPIVPLFHSVNVTLVRPWVKGLVLDPFGAPRYDAVEVDRGR